MQKLIDTRDAAESTYYRSGFNWEAFSDLAALNQVLAQYERTVAAFKDADQKNRRAASLIYPVAAADLIRLEEYALCGKYLKPEKDIKLAIECYRLRRKFETEFRESNPRSPETAKSAFVHKVTTLVALLIKNQRADDAEEVCRTALLEIDDESFKEGLASALAGNVPRPRH